MTPRNGLTLTRYRVVEIGDDTSRFAALVEDVETGRPLASCYRVDVAENITRAMEAAWSRVVPDDPDHVERLLAAQVADDDYRVSLPTFGDAVVFEYKHSEVKHAHRIVAKMVKLYNADLPTPSEGDTMDGRTA